MIQAMSGAFKPHLDPPLAPPTNTRWPTLIRKQRGGERNLAPGLVGGVFWTMSISQRAYSIVKTAAPTAAAPSSSGERDREREREREKGEEHRRRAREQEEELMGGTRVSVRNTNTKKSSGADVKESNLSQMVAVLHMRIGSLEKTAKMRMELCAEDLMPNSTKTSKNAPKMGDDMDFFNDTTAASGISSRPRQQQQQHKDNNLVSTEGVFMDPVSLVLRTKPPSETAKKLEAALEDIFGSANTTRFKGKKKSSGSGPGGTKSSQQKYDAKKSSRVKLEKQLITNMESFVTRSVLEPEMAFVAPLSYDEAPQWPISVKYTSADPLSSAVDNAEGEMDPDLILRYSLQRISLPSGEKMFRWLVKQPVVQTYYIVLFWLLKVKFFQQETDMYTESYLLHQLSAKYAMVMELLQGRTHIEHEKDFVYRFLPYILTNAVYFGFMYTCPGSRHLYTKGFRKTLLMQIVQMMHGIQLCPVSVKVSWGKLYPDDAHDDEGEGGGDGSGGAGAGVVESIPVPAALVSGRNAALQKEKERTGGESRRGILAGSDTRDGDVNQNQQQASRGRTQSAASGGATLASANNMTADEGNDTHLTSRPQTHQSDSRSHASHESEAEDPLTRTFLRAPLQRPSRDFVTTRQNIETLDAKNISPMMQEFLGVKHSSSGFKQMLARTVPISWCPAGGVDTYHRRQVPKELHDAISAKLHKSQSDFARAGVLGHRRRTAVSKQVERSCQAILQGGPTRISQTVLDLVKRRKGTGKDKEVVANDEDVAPPGYDDLFADGDLEEFLESLE